MIPELSVRKPMTMTHWKSTRQKQITRCHAAAGDAAMPADSGFFFDYGYAYFWAYFFVSSHAERKADG
jgi:hypothetical protein